MLKFRHDFAVPPKGRAGGNQTKQSKSQNMKMKLAVSGLLALAPMLMGQLALHAQDWQTVDDFAQGNGHAEARGVATDAAGGIYVVGTANGHGIVRYSADDGLQWITRDDFVSPSETNNVFNAVTVDFQGSVFVGGSAAGGEYYSRHWIVRRSTDHGLTWETVDDYWRLFHFPEEPGTNGVVFSLSSDGHGRVYGAGPLILTGCPCYNNWWVRGSSIGGTNWDTKLALFSGYGIISQATCAGEDVYVAGSTDYNDLDGNLGLILRSSDHGATWTTVFQGFRDYSKALTTDSAGNLYSAGISATSTSIVWQVRRAAPGGTSWTTLDLSVYVPWGEYGLPLPDGYYAYPSAIAVDAAGDVCVTGEFIQNWVISSPTSTTYGANQTWFTRQYLSATGQWSTTDLFSYSTNQTGMASGAAIAPSGSVFTVGFGTSDSGQRRWVVRKRASSSPIALLGALEKEVNDLVAQSAIARQPGSVLLGILDSIDAKLARGKAAPVCGQLGAFSNKVQAYLKQGALRPSDGQVLLNGADNLRQILGCQ
jgi:hypothetical protein